MHQHHRSSSRNRTDMPGQNSSQAANGSFQPGSNSGDGANERTGLLGANPIHISTDDKPSYQKYPLAFIQTTWEVLRSNYANVLLIFVPLGIIAGIAGWSEPTVFLLNFLAIVPLAGLLSFATEELSAKLGETLGGLMNATFGNAVELIVSIVALKENQIRIVQASMLGSILSNILLVRQHKHHTVSEM